MASLSQIFDAAPFNISKKSSCSLSYIPQSQPCNYLKISSRPSSSRSGIRKLQVINYNIKVGKNSKNLDGHDHKWRIWSIDNGSFGVAPLPTPHSSVIELIHDFHRAVIEKDLIHLNHLLSNKCQFQDPIFNETFQGKEDVIHFLFSVVDAMEPNMDLVIDSVIEGENLTARLMWHLEWKKKVIPYTTGCRFFECEEKEGKLFISNITGVGKRPLKPGDLLLKLLKAASTVLDSLPSDS